MIHCTPDSRYRPCHAVAAAPSVFWMENITGQRVLKPALDPCYPCNCDPCRSVARSWINVIDQAGVVADTCIRHQHHLPPEDLSEEDCWKVIDDYAYDNAVMSDRHEGLLAGCQ